MRPGLEGGRASESELGVARAQLAGWLEGLVHGMQAAMTAQQLTAQAQVQRIRHNRHPGSLSVLPETPRTCKAGLGSAGGRSACRGCALAYDGVCS